jgi:hypothetical protein
VIPAENKALSSGRDHRSRLQDALAADVD